VLLEREQGFIFYQIETKYTSNLLNVKVIEAEMTLLGPVESKKKWRLK